MMKIFYFGVVFAISTALGLKAQVAPPEILSISGYSTSGSIPEFPVPIGKSIVLAVSGTCAPGMALSYRATSSSTAVNVRVKTANPILNLGLSFGGDATNNPFTGNLKLQLFRDLTPKTAQTIAGLAQGGFYDGVKFHRIMRNFMAQGGDPLGNGTGGPGFTFDNEFSPALIFSGYGQLAMAHPGQPDNNLTPVAGTNGSQFFITMSQTRHLDFTHTIFGQLVRGFEEMNKLNQIELVNFETLGPDFAEDPVTDPEISTASVEFDSTDAVLILTATAPGVSQIAITADDRLNPTATAAFNVRAVVDSVNNHPFLKQIDDVVSEPQTISQVKLKAIDLEHDFLLFGAQFPGTVSNGLMQTSGNLLSVKPNPITYKGPIYVQTLTAQYGVNTAQDVDKFVLGVGDKKISLTTANFTAKAGVRFSGTLATITDSDLNGKVSDFTATINWGDGVSVADTGTITLDPTAGTTKRFLVSGSHSYASPGIFPVTVTVQGLRGVVETARTLANVSSGPLSASGRALAAPAGKLESTWLAWFSDENSTGNPANYSAIVDYGNGIRRRGTITLNTDGSYSVVGKQLYTDTQLYPVSILISKGNNSIVAWSTVKSTNTVTPRYLPPFPHARLSEYWQALTQTTKGTAPSMKRWLNVQVAVINSGNLPVSGGKMKFFLSTDSTLDSSDVALSLAGGQTAYTLPAFKAGEAFLFTFQKTTTVDERLVVPSGTNPTGLFLIAKIVYSDPISNYLPANRVAIQIPPPATAP